jgi:hypothetical protein
MRTNEQVLGKKISFKFFGMIAPKRKCVVLTVKGKVNIVSRMKEGEWGEKLAEEYDVGTAT